MTYDPISRLDSRVYELEHALRRITSRLEEVARFAANTDRRLERTDGLVSDLRAALPHAAMASLKRMAEESRRESAESRKQERERLIETRTGREGN